MRLPLLTLHTYVCISLFAFASVQSLKLFSIPAPEWVFSYLNDFLVIPIVATICLHGIWILKNNKAIRMNGFTIISLLILFSVYFEYYLPQQSFLYTGDIWDVVCYTLGAFIFYILQRLH